MCSDAGDIINGYGIYIDTPSGTQNNYGLYINDQPGYNIYSKGSSTKNYFEGKVGIGTNSPNEQFEITGNFRMPATSATSGKILQGNTPVLHTYGLTNIFLGSPAGNFTLTGNTNIGIGANALVALTDGDINMAIGHYALYKNTTGNDNVAVGYEAMYYNETGQGNTAIGDGALNNCIDGGMNCALGLSALFSNEHSQANVAIGTAALGSYLSGNNNTAVGHYALGDVTINSGNNNTAIGYMADCIGGTFTNATAIGYMAKVGASNSLVLGGTGANAVNVGINITNPSERLDVFGNVRAVNFNATGIFQSDGNTVIDGNGFMIPKSSSDASAPINSIYYSTTLSKLVYKDPGGTINPLY